MRNLLALLFACWTITAYSQSTGNVRISIWDGTEPWNSGTWVGTGIPYISSSATPTVAVLGNVTVTSGTMELATTQTGPHTWSGTQTFSIQTLAPDGSATSPSYAFTNDPDCGLYRIGTNNIGLATNGALHWSLTSGGALQASGAKTINFVTNSASGQLVFGSSTTAAALKQTAANTLSFDVGVTAAMTLTASGTALQLGTGYVFSPVNLGSAALPVYTFNGDNDTGIYSPGANQMSFTTSGTRQGGFAANGTFDLVGNATVAGSISIGGGTTITRVLSATGTLDFGSVASLATAELTITVTNAATGNSVSAGAPAAIEAGLIWSAYVSASNTVTIRVYNSTVSPIDPASATWRATVFQF